MNVSGMATPLPVPVTVEAAAPLVQAAGRPTGALAAVEAGFRERLQRLGLAATPELRVHPGDGTRALRVRVHGRLQPFAPELMTRVWQAVAPEDRADVRQWQAPPSPDGFPDGWFRSFVDELTTASAADEDWELALRFAGQLAVEVAFERPGCLLGSVQLDGEQPRDGLPDALEELLSLGLPPSAAAVAQALADSERLGTPLRDTVEALAARRPDHVEILVPATQFHDVVRGDVEEPSLPVYSEHVAKDVHKAFRKMERKLFADLGVRLPELVLRREDGLRAGVLRLVVNNLVTPPVPFSSLADGVGAELRWQAGRLLGIEDVEWALVRLDEVFSTLVSAVLERVALGDLTRVLRALLEEQVSIRDLRALLERLVQYDTIPVDAYRHVVLDDRLPVPREPSAHPGPLWGRYLAFVRSGSGLRNRLTYEYRLDGLVAEQVNAIHLPEQLEERVQATVAEGPGPGGAWEALRAEVLDEVWRARSRLSDEARFVLQVRDPLTRRVVRDQIAAELPDLPVVATGELRRDVKVVEAGSRQPVADAPTPQGRQPVRPGRGRLHIPRIPHPPPRSGV
jgi:hypothetical protein